MANIQKSTQMTQEQLAILVLWQQVNASLSAYNKLIKTFFNAQNAWQATVADWQEVGLHAKHIERHSDINQTKQFLDNINTALAQGQYQILFNLNNTNFDKVNNDNISIDTKIAFPTQLNELFDPPPLLFVRGNVSRLHEAQIAIVGSRKPTPHAQKITFDMAQYLAQSGYIVTSGLAQGVDYQAHIGALTQSDKIAQGRTVGVMGTGIDVCYPRHHNTLFSQIVEEGGCLISELLPQTPANKHTFPRRNRIVAGLSLGTIVTEATIKSGSLITARLTSEQGKQVFAIPSHINNVNAEGCHHLIREGATLIYHPDQVIDDLRYQQIQPTVIADSSNLENNTARNISSNKTISKDTISQNLGSQQTVIKNHFPVNHNTDVGMSEAIIKQEPSTKLPLPKSPLPKLPLPNADLPEDLIKLFSQIDWQGVDIDNLVGKLHIPIHLLLGQLMELELLGLIMEQEGRYVRV